MAKIIILNGVAKKKGNTSRLIDAFKDGVSDDHTVIDFYLQNMNIKGCLDCGGCLRNRDEISCVQKDDMEEILKQFVDADIIVFASPMYWGTISGPLKTAVDRLYPFCNPYYAPPIKETILLMTANSTMYQLAVDWYSVFQLMGWKNRGMALGIDKINDAYKLGSEIK